MSVKRVLFIDDDNIDENVESLKRKLRKGGKTLLEKILFLGDDKYRVKDESGNSVLDLVKIQTALRSEHFTEQYDMVACDYFFANDELDGYQILKWLKNVSSSERQKIRKAIFVLYSSEGDKLAKDLNSIKDLSQLIKLKLYDFLKRDNLANDISNILLNENNSFNFSQSLLAELEKYPDFKFRSVYPKFIGKSLKDITNEIDKDSPNGIKFQENLIELTIAHLIELNKTETK